MRKLLRDSARTLLIVVAIVLIDGTRGAAAASPVAVDDGSVFGVADLSRLGGAAVSASVVAWRVVAQGLTVALTIGLVSGIALVRRPSAVPVDDEKGA